MFEVENPFSDIELSKSSKKANFNNPSFFIILGIIFLIFTYFFVELYQIKFKAESQQTHSITLSLLSGNPSYPDSPIKSKERQNKIEDNKDASYEKNISLSIEDQNIVINAQDQISVESSVLHLKSLQIKSDFALNIQDFFSWKSVDILPKLIKLESNNFESQKSDLTQSIINSEENRRAKIAICLLGFGNIDQIVHQANNNLPAEITFGFQITNENSKNNLILSHQNNHEILLMVPMESLSYPDEDPGAQILLTGLTPKDLSDRLKYHLSQVENMIIGITPFSGSRFLSSEADITILLNELKIQDLIIFESLLSSQSMLRKVAKKMNFPYGSANLCIDQSLDQNDIINQLKELEKISLEKGMAIGYLSANILTIGTMAQWTKDLDQNKFKLVSLSNLINKENTYGSHD